MAAGLLQVFQAAVPQELLRAADPELQAFYQGPAVLRVEGLFAHWFGVSAQGNEARIALVSGWESDGAIAEFVRANRLPRREGRIAEIVALGATERWDLVDQVVSTFEPGQAAVLRLIRAKVSPDRLDAVLADLAEARAGVSARTDVAVSQLASRSAGDLTELLVLTAWRDATAIAAMQDRVADWWDRLAREQHLPEVLVDTFELRPSGLLRLTPSGPAVVITDDSGMIVDATPAAVGMLGRSVWDLFTIRFEELPRPLDDGTALIPRPEGGSIHVHVARAPNMPAPGRHAALLMPAFEPKPDPASVEATIAGAYRRGPVEAAPEPAYDGPTPSIGQVLTPLPAPSVS